MKIIITERQLKRIIREFEEDIYSEGLKNLADKIESEIKEYSVSTNDKNWRIEMEQNLIPNLVQMLKKHIIDFINRFFKTEEYESSLENLESYVDGLFKIMGKQIVMGQHLIIDGYEKYIYSTPYILFKFYSDNFIGEMAALITLIREGLPEDNKEDLTLDIQMSKNKYAPAYSGQEVENEDAKRIYDWEYTKNILEKLLFEFIVTEKYVNKELYNKIMEKGIINTMLEKMENVMKENDYKIFGLIRQNNWRHDFMNFLKSYTDYYKTLFKGNEQQFYAKINLDKKIPDEIFFGRLLWEMSYWIKSN